MIQHSISLLSFCYIIFININQDRRWIFQDSIIYYYIYDDISVKWLVQLIIFYNFFFIDQLLSCSQSTSNFQSTPALEFLFIPFQIVFILRNKITRLPNSEAPFNSVKTTWILRCKRALHFLHVFARCHRYGKNIPFSVPLSAPNKGKGKKELAFTVNRSS